MLELWAPSLAGDPEAVDWWARWLRSGTSPGAMRTMGLMYHELDVRPLLSSVTAPTLVLYRADDELIRAPLARVVARGIPNAREVELAGADHLFVAGDQDAMLDEVEEFVTGRPAEPVRERILATVLFTDIVRSTEHAAELGDRRWRELLTQHDRIAERELARHRGRMVKSFGDAVFATFDGPARAVRCALAIRAARRRSASSCAPASTPASARSSAATWPGWRSTSPRACRRPRARRGPHLGHGQGPRRRLRPRVRGPRAPRAEGRPG